MKYFFVLILMFLFMGCSDSVTDTHDHKTDAIEHASHVDAVDVEFEVEAPSLTIEGGGCLENNGEYYRYHCPSQTSSQCRDGDRRQMMSCFTNICYFCNNP